MTVNWIEPIYDRTSADVLTAEANPTMKNLKGCYNASDLNRIENNIKYVSEDMLERKIIRVPLALTIKTDWIQSDIPTREDVTRIIDNINLLMSLSNQEIAHKFRTIYSSSQFSYSLANAIEYNLEVMKNQPELPIQKWLLSVEHGIITNSEGEQNTSMYVAEEETITIEGIPYGDDSEYMSFTHWSGNADDLQYVGDVNAQKTTYTMKYHDDDDYSILLTANFKTRFPRRLTLNEASIYEGELAGQSSGIFFAGDEILIVADIAPAGKCFYTFEGTQAGVDNLTSGPEPSTSWLVMPDCDVTLTSKFINAGQHKVTVDGQIQGWYDYNTYVYLQATPPGERYTFAYWAGTDVGYLEDITVGSFLMPDVNVSFNSVWTYQYSYNAVTVINGLINGLETQGNLRQDTSHKIVANAAPEGKEFSHWTLEGLGSFANVNAANTTFTIGDGNAVITANYKDIPPSHTVTVENENNNGSTRSFTVREGDRYSVSSNEVLTDYMFKQWDKNGSKYSTSTSISATMGTEDVTYTAVYRDRESYTLTVEGGTGSGTYKERQSVTIKGNAPETGYNWSRWNCSSGSYHSIGSLYSQSTTLVMGRSDCTMTATYAEIITYNYYDLTVLNGSGSGNYREGTTVSCYGNQPPETYEFSHWTDEEGNIISYSNPYRCPIDKDKTIKAHYKPIPWFDVTIINGDLDSLNSGKTTGTYLRDSQPVIVMRPAPEGQQFLQWVVKECDNEDYKNNAVYQLLAERTTLNPLRGNITIEAFYYIPKPETTYVLTVMGKNGEITTYNAAAGESVTIYADPPDDGYYFFKWEGDEQYVVDKYADVTSVNMPPKNIELHMVYEREGATTKYHVEIGGGELLVVDGDYERWTTEAEFEERTQVQIRATGILPGWKFDRWRDDDNGMSVSTVNEPTAETTYLTVEDFPIYVYRDTLRYEDFRFQIANSINPETDSVSGAYYETQPVAVYFDLPSDDNVHYTFVRWSGNDLAYIKLFDGGIFNINKAGTADDYQTIKMPGRNITLTGIYTTAYKVSIINGVIEKDNEISGYYSTGTNLKIKADEPSENLLFDCWEGDIEFIDNKYSPNPTLTVPEKATQLKAKYLDIRNRNDVGIVDSNLYTATNVDISNINVVAGTVKKGMLLFDSKGHIYVVSNVVENTVAIVRLTMKEE